MGYTKYLTIIPRVRLGCESIAAKWDIDLDAMRARGIIVFVKLIQLVGQKYPEQKNFTQLKLDFNPFLPPKSPHFLLLVGYNI